MLADRIGMTTNSIVLKSPAELAIMRQSGQLLAQVFADIDQWIVRRFIYTGH